MAAEALGEGVGRELRSLRHRERGRTEVLPRVRHALALACPSCGIPNPPEAKFCGECGASLDAARAAARGRPPPAAERRLVSVLFADLVGFTALSESRDAEEVRELLSALLRHLPRG